MNARSDILVVDDESLVLASIRKVLLSEGFSLDETASAEMALPKLQGSAYRLVLCDLKLPEADGFTVLRMARESQPDTPVVMITGYATRESAVTSFNSGAFDFLPKPFDTDELLGVVRRALNYAASDRAAQRATNLAEFRAMHGDTTRRSVELYALGRHSWVSLEPSGSARIWTGETFAGVEHVRSLELPDVNEELLQGNECGRILSQGARVHRVWAPLSGHVVATNRELQLGLGDETESIVSQWIVRITPTNLDSELPDLTHR